MKATVANQGIIELSASDLVKSTDFREVKPDDRFVIVSSSDDILPVVWLTDNPTMTAESITGATVKLHGKEVSALSVPPYARSLKDEVRITVKKSDDMFKWDEWAKDNGITSSWMNNRKRHGLTGMITTLLSELSLFLNL